MCFTQGMSAALAALSFATAWYEWKTFKCWQYSAGIAYWGAMEFLQVIQHSYAAGPEDNYAMCKDPTNNFLTDVGSAHIAFQPAFISLTLFSIFRRHDIEARILGDFILKLCLGMGFWFVSWAWLSHLMGVEQDLLPPATEDCPNYNWLVQGYDGYLKQATPDANGKACTFYAPTKTGHLAWAIPMWKQNYFFPSPCVHFLLSFGPYIILTKYPFLQVSAILFYLTGPLLAKYLTLSVNEQPAIWCFYSVVQATLFVVSIRFFGWANKPVPAKFTHPGTYGEQPITYIREDLANGTTNGEDGNPLLDANGNKSF